MSIEVRRLQHCEEMDDEAPLGTSRQCLDEVISSGLVVLVCLWTTSNIFRNSAKAETKLVKSSCFGDFCFPQTKLFYPRTDPDPFTLKPNHPECNGLHAQDSRFHLGGNNFWDLFTFCFLHFFHPMNQRLDHLDTTVKQQRIYKS